MSEVGIVPRGYGLTVNFPDRAIFISPTAWVFGIVISSPEKEIKRKWEEYSDYSYSELEKRVIKEYGCKNFLRVEGTGTVRYPIEVGGTVADGVVKSRRDGRRRGRYGRNSTYHNVTVKGITLDNGEIRKTFSISCGCEDYKYGRIKEENRTYSVMCAHVAALIYSVSQGKVQKYCKDMIGDGFVVPYEIPDELVVRTLEMRFFEHKTRFEIDRKLLEYDIISEPFKKGISEII